MKRVSLIFFFLFAAGVFSISVSGVTLENGESDGPVRGVIVDWQDARIVNASILVEGKNFRRELASDDSGEFNVVLPIGIYRVTVSHPVFKTHVIKKLRVSGSELPVLRVMLKIKTALEGGGKCPKGKICL